jgi:hypothetical protein
VVADELVGPVAQQRRRHGIGEDERGSIDQKMRGAGGRRGERGLARPGKGCHTVKLTTNSEILPQNEKYGKPV